MDKTITNCIECGSDYWKGSSKMEDLCPQCAHELYGYVNCLHTLSKGRCTKCYWNGSTSNYLKNE